MIEFCCLTLIDAKHSQAESDQDIEEVIILMKERKSSMDSKQHKGDVMMK